MKTTIDISDDLLRRAKLAALERGTTLRTVVEEALERALGPAVAEAVPLRTVTWGRAKGAARLLLSDDEVLEAIAREREAADPDRWLQRFGFVPPGGERE